MLIVRISNEMDLPETVVHRVILRLSSEMRAALLRREPVELDGIGTLSIMDVRCKQSLPDPNAEPILVNAENGLRQRPFQKSCLFQVMPRVVLDTDPKLQIKVAAFLNQSTGGPAYLSTRFTEQECETIRSQIASGQETIKGLARKLGADKGVIRRIVRAQLNQQPKEEEGDNDHE